LARELVFVALWMSFQKAVCGRAVTEVAMISTATIASSSSMGSAASGVRSLPRSVADAM
jgi:hypothetical protein